MSSHLVGGILGRSRSAQPAKKILDFEFSRQIFERHSVDREEAVPAQDSDDDTSDSSSEDGEDEPPLSKEQIECVESLLVGSHSYALYKQQLVDFVHQTYEKRVHKALGDCLVSSDGSRLDQTGTAAIAYELSWVPTGLVAFASTFPISTRDRLIGSIERAMGEQWGWWPLADPKRTGPPAFSRLTWPYLCGAYEYIDVPVKTADALREVLRNAPLFMEDPLLHDSTASTKIPTLAAASGSAAHATKAASSTTQTSTTSKAATGAQSSSTPQQVSSSTSQTKPGTPNKQATATTAQPPINLRYVYFCTETGLSGGTFKYSVIKTHLLEHDPQFFQQLKKEYIDSRGSVREWFSWWRYDHCEFYQFQKFASELSEPVVVGFPSETDPDYDFQPSPLKPHSRPPYGPILKSEYRHRFYTSCTSCHSWHILHQQRKNAYNQADTSRIRVLPKRKQEVDMTDSESEVFWGIIARERRGFAWVLAYGCLANAPGVVFFFLWLFSWGHASDLQNAAIPLTISMCLTLTFATVLYEDRRGDARVR
ncbi:hypothetical protein B0A48_02354 [Cryoendolithus antarcticus]|uniref:Uncharacterized protein n=1 Tax=Cryoendolithus antarcticus TaxID=1507870 RepID=A0A1V8TNE6_9PEZI|nr:hypothetical protein B0A48_02354 [Cryoendolithus antarcticus]